MHLSDSTYNEAVALSKTYVFDTTPKAGYSLEMFARQTETYAKILSMETDINRRVECYNIFRHTQYGGLFK